MNGRILLPTQGESERVGHFKSNQALRYDSYKRPETTRVQPDLLVKPQGVPYGTPRVRYNNNHEDHFFHSTSMGNLKVMKAQKPDGLTCQTPKSSTSSSQNDFWTVRK